MNPIRWFRRRPRPEPIIAPEFVEMLAAFRQARPRTTVLPPSVDEQLVERVRKLTAEVAELRQAVDRLADR